MLMSRTSFSKVEPQASVEASKSHLSIFVVLGSNESVHCQ